MTLEGLLIYLAGIVSSVISYFTYHHLIKSDRTVLYAEVRIRAFDRSGQARIDHPLSDKFARINGAILGNEGISVKLINKSKHEAQITDIAFKARRGFKHKVAALESVTTREPMRFPRVVNARETEVFDFDIDPDHFLEHKFRSIRIVTGDGKIHRFPIAPSFLTKLRKGIPAIRS